VIHTRDVSPTESDEVRRISIAVLDDMPPYVPDPEKYAWLLPDGERIVIGAYDDGRLCGFCTVDTIEQFRDLAYVNASPAGTCYVSALTLEPRMRGQGLGTQLLREAVNTARTRNWAYASGHFRAGASEHAARSVLTDLIRVAIAPHHLGSWETYWYLLGKL